MTYAIATCRRLGSVARIGLTVRNVPWVRRRMRSRALVYGALRGWLPAPEAPVAALELVLDVLKQSTLEDAASVADGEPSGRRSVVPREPGRGTTVMQPEAVDGTGDDAAAWVRLLGQLMGGGKREGG